MHKTSLRRKYFIDRKFQAKFIILVALIISFSLLALVGVVIYSSKDTSTVRMVNGRVWAQQTLDFILPIIIITFLVIFPTSIIVASYISMRVSHKISGPLYRLLQEIKAVADGDFTRDFSIRSKDQLQDLAKSLCEMNASLKKQHSHTIEVFNNLRRFLILKEFSLSRKDADECIVMLKEMQTALDKFKI